jgi:hypothetical protein
LRPPSALPDACSSSAAAERGGPHRVDLGAHLGQALRPRAVPAAGTVAALVHQARLEQHAQVVRDRLPRDVEALGDLAGGALAVRDQRHHLAPARVREHLEEVRAHG